MRENLYVSSSPHLRAAKTTRGIMLDVILSLLPALVAGCVIYGMGALLVVGFCVLSCVLLEFVTRLILRRPNTIGDLSAVVTGLLLGLSLPVSMGQHLHLTLVGSFTAIVVVKQMFGGLGNNFVNPALAGRIVMLVSFPSQMTDWSSILDKALDGVTSATPLVAENGAYSMADLLLGRSGGCIGETCVPALLLGFAYLLIRRVIKPVIPVCYVGSFALLTFLLSFAMPVNVAAQLFSGGLLLGAVYMATDYVTSPTGTFGKVIYGVGCGVLTALMRLFAAMPEGVSFAILLMNIATPLIERIPSPEKWGRKGGRVK